LKHERLLRLYLCAKSRPTWARGLKLRKRMRARPAVVVAPHVGAWIET
jgi:hypothetical protein